MWKTVKLGDILSLQNGYAFKSNEYADDGYSSCELPTFSKDLFQHTIQST